ncbi:hypothetical protein [Falsirhodobacter sp. alg1]|uniref:hypothetical protein n=1 Tax=Falsirhodobacter sp. alg1 TaxID=1472418 RepID=UPI000788BA5C|nr:hypothetical protein [Falsirhodobacter sp. alg1]
MSDFSTNGGSSGSDHLKQKADEVKTQFSRESDELKNKAKAGLSDAKDAAAERGEAAKERAADEISSTSKALRAAAGELEEGSIQHQMFMQASDAVGGFSSAMNDHSISEIVDNLTRFGRRNPAAVIGGAVLAGLVVSRFIRAGENKPEVESQLPATTAYSVDPYAKERFNG